MFFIVWRGLGFLAPIILITITMILSISADLLTHTDNYGDSHRWVYSVGCLLGALACWHIGKKLNGKPGRILIDEITGQRIELKTTHSCFFIPFEYWAIISIIFSIGILFVK